MDEYPLFINLQYALTAFSDYPGNSTDRAVFADIAQFANRYGVSYTTTRSIAARIGRRREEVSKSVNRLKDKGFWTITQEKKGLDRHPRNIYHIASQFIRRHPDKRSKHFNASKWRRWCEIGKKRAITIALKKKAAEKLLTMAGGKQAAAATPQAAQPASASPTPAQAREAREQRGGGFAGFGGVLSGLFPAASATVQPVKEDYSQQVPRGGWSQALREHEAQPVPAPAPQAPADGTAGAWQEVASDYYSRASRPTAASAYPADSSSPWPSSTAPATVQQPPTQPTASGQRERKAQAYDELQPLRERLRQQGTASAPMMPDTTGDHSGAWQEVARDYRRASRPAEMASPSRWPATTTQPVQLIQRPAPTPAVEQNAQATRDYWKRKLREHEARQQAAAAMGEAR